MVCVCGCDDVVVDDDDGFVVETCFWRQETVDVKKYCPLMQDQTHWTTTEVDSELLI